MLLVKLQCYGVRPKFNLHHLQNISMGLKMPALTRKSGIPQIEFVGQLRKLNANDGIE